MGDVAEEFERRAFAAELEDVLEQHAVEEALGLTHPQPDQPHTVVPYTQAVGPTTEALPIPNKLALYAIAAEAARSGYFPDVRQTAQAFMKIVFGAEIGAGPAASLVGVYLVNGRPAYSANLIAAAIARSPHHDYKIRTLTNEACVLEFFRDGQAVGRSEFTLKDAQLAGLLGKPGPWRAYPRNMLFARAMTNGFRFYVPEIAGGIPAYTPEELGLVVDTETGEVIDGQAFVSEPAPSAPAADGTARPRVTTLAAVDETEPPDLLADD